MSAEWRDTLHFFALLALTFGAELGLAWAAGRQRLPWAVLYGATMLAGALLLRRKVLA